MSFYLFLFIEFSCLVSISLSSNILQCIMAKYCHYVSIYSAFLASEVCIHFIETLVCVCVCVYVKYSSS